MKGKYVAVEICVDCRNGSKKNKIIYQLKGNSMKICLKNRSLLLTVLKASCKEKFLQYSLFSLKTM